ncbi:MAG: tyrosine-type recombinase/integrase [Acidobacteria bacterium]|nr:tyrosine-type recombinase/integrase [Acidobacteriota bacterium]
MKVSEAVDPFITHCQAERLVAGSTLAKYQDCFRSWIFPWLGTRDLEAISLLDVLRMRKAMVEKGLSTARQYSIVICLKSFLRFCRQTFGVQCLDPREIKLPKRDSPEVEYLTNEEIQKVLNAINIHTFTGSRLRAMVELLLATGMRISEALALNREPFDVGSVEVQIVGKGKRTRAVFFSPRCQFWVKEYLNRRVDDDPALFVTTGFPVRRLRREDISRFFHNLKEKAKITKKLTPHVLRHTFCTNLLFNGADITHIRDLAGHADIQTTARYYLGKDKAVLQDVVRRCLNYEIEVDGGAPQQTRI